MPFPKPQKRANPHPKQIKIQQPQYPPRYKESAGRGRQRKQGNREGEKDDREVNDSEEQGRVTDADLD